MGEKATSDNEVLRAVELEQKRLPWVNRAEPMPPARLPEISYEGVWALRG